MRVKKIIILALLAMPMMAMAQKYEPIQEAKVENMKVSAVYQAWLSKYEEVGRNINQVSDQYQKEMEKRGYPKKKTVQRKMSLVSQYIQLLQQERDTPELNVNLDVNKVNRKIAAWQEQLQGLGELLKKI